MDTADDDTTITKLNVAQADKAKPPEKVDSLTISSTALTDIGNKRLHNEDAFYSSDEKGVWFVADGVGGHNAGDFASQSLVDAIANFKPEANLDDSVDTLEYLIQQTNEMLINKAAQIGEGAFIGSTIVLLAADKSNGIILWAGDSRIYRIRADEIEQLTHDHSLINDMIKAGELDPDDFDAYPESNKITRAIGFIKDLDLDLRKLSILPGDKYILCSDGLTKYLNDEEILSTTRDETVASSTQKLLQKALDAGGTDNITVLTIEFSEG
jgi:serine/threonine protein phosphatase PrpC